LPQIVGRQKRPDKKACDYPAFSGTFSTVRGRFFSIKIRLKSPAATWHKPTSNADALKLTRFSGGMRTGAAVMRHDPPVEEGN